MKKYYIALLAAVILAAASYLISINKRSIYGSFDFDSAINEQDVENPLYLYFFFSKQNCKSCLEIIKVLNRLSEPYKVIGVVPDTEFAQLSDLRSSTEATFDIIGAGKFTKIQPLYTPTVIGVSKKKKIYFVLPAVPGGESFFEGFIRAFYDRAYPLIMNN